MAWNTELPTARTYCRGGETGGEAHGEPGDPQPSAPDPSQFSSEPADHGGGYLVSWNPLSPARWSDHKVNIGHHLVVEHDGVPADRSITAEAPEHKHLLISSSTQRTCVFLCAGVCIGVWVRARGRCSLHFLGVNPSFLQLPCLSGVGVVTCGALL